MTGESESVKRENCKDLLVSVIIPVYQVSAYVERCLRSVMNQTYQNIECIIVDDCSTDDSIDKCEKLIVKYKGAIEFKILHHEVNRGLSAARNTGTDAASGDYIFYLDSDDELTPDCLERLIQPVFKDASIEVVLGYHNYITDEWLDTNSDQKQMKEANIASLADIRDYYYNEKGWFPVSAWNKLVRKDFLERNQLHFIEGLLYEDEPWVFHVIKNLKRLYVIPAVTYLYYRRPNSIVTGTSREKKAQHFGLIFEEIAAHFTFGEEGREALFYVRDFCYYYLNYPKISSYKRASCLFKKALKDGQHRKELIYLILTEYASKTSFGRFLFPIALKVRVIMLSPFRCLKHRADERRYCKVFINNRENMNHMKFINDQLMDEVSEQAKTSPRLRMNFNFHQSLDEKCHRMLNAVEPGTVVPIHRHPSKDESFVILRGKVRVTTHNDEGSIIEDIVLDQNEGQYGVNIPKGVWHKLESLESGSVIFECKEGPFVPHEEEGILSIVKSEK